MQKQTFNIKDMEFELLMWVYIYLNSSLFIYEGSRVLFKMNNNNNNKNKRSLVEESFRNYWELQYDYNKTILDLLTNERIGITPMTITVGDDRGKKEWFASYEHDSFNPHLDVTSIADAYHDGATPGEAVVKCYLIKKLGKQISITINEKGDYVHVESA